MTLEIIYYITQIIAVGLILVSLLAIYVQQRKDHALARAETIRALTVFARDFNLILVTEPRVLESVQVCLRDYRSASSREQIDFLQFFQGAVHLSEQALFMEQEKLLPESTFHKYSDILLAITKTPGGRQIWQRMKYAFSNQVRIYIDKKLSDPNNKIRPVWDIVLGLGSNPEMEPTQGKPVNPPNEE